MTMSFTQSAVDMLVTLPVNGSYQFWGQIKKEGQIYDLTGKTIFATVRQYALPMVPLLSGAYENIPVTAGNPDISATDGGVLWDMELLAASFPVPTVSTETEKYQVRYYVVEDDYMPQLALFDVVQSSRG